MIHDWHKNEIVGIKEGHINILFAGCSVTAGEALQEEDMYTRKVAKEISKIHNKDVSSDNVAVPGASVARSFDQCFQYFETHGNPDYVFLFLPDSDRDSTTIRSKAFVYLRMYHHLKVYCNSHNIKLYISTWAVDINETGKSIVPSGIREKFKLPPKKGFDWDPTIERPWWTEQIKNSKIFDLIFKNAKEYVSYTKEEMSMAVYELDKKSSHPNSLLAEDGLHPGISFHTFWANLFMDAVRKDLEE